MDTVTSAESRKRSLTLRVRSSRRPVATDELLVRNWYILSSSHFKTRLRWWRSVYLYHTYSISTETGYCPPHPASIIKTFWRQKTIIPLKSDFGYADNVKGNIIYISCRNKHCLPRFWLAPSFLAKLSGQRELRELTLMASTFPASPSILTPDQCPGRRNLFCLNGKQFFIMQSCKKCYEGNFALLLAFIVLAFNSQLRSGPGKSIIVL